MIGFMPMPGGGQELRAFDGHRKVRIQRDADGIRMAVAGCRDGRQTASYFAARNLRQLRREAPQAYEIYNTFCNTDGGERYPELEQELKTRLDAAKVSADKQQRIMDQLLRVGQAHAQEYDADADEKDGLVGAWYRESDRFREMVSAVGVMVPENLRLPLPAGRRLGIDDGQLPAGVTWGAPVARVQSGSRAARLGLKAGDVIQMLNGLQIRSPDDLGDVMAAEPTMLTIEGIRNGTPFTLKEK